MSVRYEVSENFTNKIVSHHREVHLAIALIANEIVGNHVDHTKRPILGIGKYEGGVSVFIQENDKVTRKEIFIGTNHVMDDWDRYNNAPKPAEQAVVDAINTVIKEVKKNGVEWLNKYTKLLPRYAMFDPLNSFFKHQIK